MSIILVNLIVSVLQGIGTMFFSNFALDELYVTVFDCEKYLTTATRTEFFNVLMSVTYGVGISMIILKFLKKAFDVYVLWTDGDPDADPFLLLTNFVRAVATALVFQWLYGVFADVFADVLDTVLGKINGNTNAFDSVVNSITSMGLVPSIAGLIFFICWIILYFSFMARGIEIMVMRAGVPFACAGLVDNDKGVFRAYFNQFVKSIRDYADTDNSMQNRT